MISVNIYVLTHVCMYIVCSVVDVSRKEKAGLEHSCAPQKGWAPRLYHDVQALPLVESASYVLKVNV